MGNGMLSQEEIDALLHGTNEVEAESGALDSTASAESADQGAAPQDPFSDMEKDALGEIANISMGTAATALSQLLGKKVEITTPKVDVTTSEQIRKDYPIPSVIVNVKYKVGLEGSNLLILSQKDGAVIVDLMMGGDGTNPSAELSEIHLSGIGEAMNQMMGSAATSMSTMFSSVVDITPPDLVLNDMAEDQKDIIHDFLQVGEPLVRISFRMVVGNVIDSILVQVIPLDVAKGMVQKLMGGMSSEKEPAPVQTSYTPPAPEVPVAQAPVAAASAAYNTPPLEQTMGYGSAPAGNLSHVSHTPTAAVQPVQFAPLHPAAQSGHVDNLGLILDVPLQVSVELGRARKTIKEILELGPGSVIELERLAGEPVDMIVNGKLIAKCEVVVINETFGIRITDIIQPAERVRNLN